MGGGAERKHKFMEEHAVDAIVVCDQKTHRIRAPAIPWRRKTKLSLMGGQTLHSGRQDRASA
jgi:hypothetical protein